MRLEFCDCRQVPIAYDNFIWFKPADFGQRAFSISAPITSLWCDRGLFYPWKVVEKNFLKNLKKTSYKSEKISQLVSEGKNLTNLENRIHHYQHLQESLLKLRFTLRATLLLNSSICDFGTVRVSCSAFPPNDLHWVSRYIARCPLGVLFIVPFWEQVRISCSKIIIALQNGSLSTNRTHTAFDPCFDDGFPFIAAGTAFPPNILCWLLIDCIGSQRQILFRPLCGKGWVLCF